MMTHGIVPRKMTSTFENLILLQAFVFFRVVQLMSRFNGTIFAACVRYFSLKSRGQKVIKFLSKKKLLNHLVRDESRHLNLLKIVTITELPSVYSQITCKVYH